jgi:hypothetical protein
METTATTQPTERLVELCTDVLITAVEGGIGYWSALTSYKWDAPPGERHASIVDVEEEGEPGSTVTLVDLEKAMSKIAAGEAQVRPSLRETVRLALEQGDACPMGGDDIDADVADQIFQIAVFGEVIYG